MGANNSKPEAQTSQHIFTGESPVRFSQNLIDSLQNSAETDSTRAKALELHIQARVAEELERLQTRESQMLQELSEKVSSAEQSKPAAEISEAAQSAGDKLRDLGRDSVQKEIAELRQRLEGRRKLEDLDKDVEHAKEDVVKCLRINDRRPLDCYKEVSTFKTQVARLEKGFVDRVIG
ncbi:DUF1690-domain-containing protein [Xylona heveae TC161]|uniref:DUF1690-domain-containing protein n=1 Tax=Xylona heveae (strain CBS 132557 / TC161) TaxID=1328760 RepID=A0A165FGE4_XYLHT|nr:DUF1690-domain-containing protein [Xylona heveae TC161]KZF20946.1 DUF1690-domain-containing protein [Xylona heveae TC161]